MKKLRISFLAFAASLNISVYAQSVDEIINKEVDAIGGKDKLSQMTSVYMESNVQMMGSDVPAKVSVVYGKGYKSEMEVNGSQIAYCYTDKSGWVINPMAG